MRSAAAWVWASAAGALGFSLGALLAPQAPSPDARVAAQLEALAGEVRRGFQDTGSRLTQLEHQRPQSVDATGTAPEPAARRAPAASKPDTPEQLAAASRTNEAMAYIDRITPGGRWTDENAAQLRDSMVGLSDEQSQAVLNRLMRAINEQGLRKVGMTLF